ncbi:MAG: LCP family protein [Clostridiales bacterium]|nr:LCP family protein [Clostridiales bacterium]
MSRKDQDLDDLLNFDYGKPIPEEHSSDGAKSQYDEAKAYSELRGQPRERKAQEVSGDVKRRSRQEHPSEVELAAAKKQAQKEAYDKYRSTYGNKKTKSNKKKRKAGKFHKGLSVLYLISLVVFAAIMTILDILPFVTLIIFYLILILLSFILVVQLRKKNISPTVRDIASVTSILLMGMYLLGSAYAIGTLTFLNYTSVDNDKRVEKITKDPFNFVITGIDVNGTIDEQGRSDVNMVVTVNPSTEQILMTSIPRDYQIYMPDMDYAMDKLTHTGFYSVATTVGAEESLLDIDANYYVKVNFTTVKKFINAIGGVDVKSDYEFVPVKRKNWTVKKGWNHMNGEEALAFARERKAFDEGDNQRVKNQQAVLEAILKKAMNSKTMVLSYNKVLSELKKYFEMSFSSREMRSLVKMQLARNPKWNITKNALVGGDGSMGTYTTGSAAAYVMTQDPDSIEMAKSYIEAVMNGQTLKTEKDGSITIIE